MHPGDITGTGLGSAAPEAVPAPQAAGGCRQVRAVCGAPHSTATGSRVWVPLFAALSGHLGTSWCSLNGLPADFMASKLPLKQSSYGPRREEGVCLSPTKLGKFWRKRGKILGSISTKRSAKELGAWEFILRHTN